MINRTLLFLLLYTFRTSVYQYDYDILYYGILFRSLGQYNITSRLRLESSIIYMYTVIHEVLPHNIYFVIVFVCFLHCRQTQNIIK